MIVTDILILLICVYAAYVGYKRGFILVMAELAGFVLASAFATFTYQPVGSWLVWWAGISAPLANVAAFIVTWIFVEIVWALFVHLVIIRRLTHRVQFHTYNRVGGAAGSVVRALLIITVALMIFSGLPISAAAKEPVTGSFYAQAALSFTNRWQSAINQGLGRDIGSSLTVFTVSNDPESTQRTDLGFTTTEVKLAPADEAIDLELINKERTSRGLSALTINDKARDVARAYAKRMLADGVFSHVDNDHHSPFDRMTAGHVTFKAAGENLAYAPTIQLAHTGLMNSPGHKANILSPNYKRVGIGVVDAGQYGLMVVQDFTD